MVSSFLFVSAQIACFVHQISSTNLIYFSFQYLQFLVLRGFSELMVLLLCSLN